MNKIVKNSVSYLDHLKIVGGIIYEIFKLGLKSYLKDQSENKNLKTKGDIK